MTQTGEDARTNSDLLTQWRKLQEIRRQLIRDGLLTAESKPDEVLATLRRILPADLMGSKK
jgi:hypothetical protein